MEFFNEARKKFASPEKLFYLSDDGHYYAYWPKSYKGTKSTLQSRNSLIGNFTEKFSADLLREFADLKGWHVVQGVVCESIGLTNRSPADIAICKSPGTHQNAEDIFAIFEVKMSIVWNWELISSDENETLRCLGDYRTHQGNPGLLRSDSMLKAIGKSINIRVSHYYGSHIPIIILGNTPITNSYVQKVDHLKGTGVIQGFWSLNPSPIDNNENYIDNTPQEGFICIKSAKYLNNLLESLLSQRKEYFSGMITKSQLGRIVQEANLENELEKKGEKFLLLLRNSHEKN